MNLENIFNGEASYSYSISDTFSKSLFDEIIPEFAFVGRSNVGKSSLINFILKRKNLVRTSKTPGQTQKINIFKVKELFTIADLPGYGFANVSLSMRNKWEKLMLYYFSNRQNLRIVFILIDARRGIKKVDKDMQNLLARIGIQNQFIITKSDYIKNIESNYIISSVKENIGADKIREVICSML